MYSIVNIKNICPLRANNVFTYKYKFFYLNRINSCFYEDIRRRYISLLEDDFVLSQVKIHYYLFLYFSSLTERRALYFLSTFLLRVANILITQLISYN